MLITIDRVRGNGGGEGRRENLGSRDGDGGIKTLGMNGGHGKPEQIWTGDGHRNRRLQRADHNCQGT